MASTLPIAIDRLDGLEPEDRARLLRRSGAELDAVLPAVREIVADVRARGDAALLDWTAKLDGVRLSHLEVSPEEMEDALRAVSPELVAAIEQALDHLQMFHSAQLQPQPVVEPRPGIRLWREWRPIERVGAYVPGGRAFYPSVALMNVVPAVVAGCGEIVVCSPPGRDGLIPPSILVAAQLAGATRCFKLGGAVAVAAMAYGTQSVPSALKLFGAGSAYVTAAKLLVRNDVEIDLPAGPSEILVVADAGAHTHAAWIAADLLAQSEHGEDSASVLVTPSVELAERVAAEVGRQLGHLGREETVAAALRTYGRILVVDTIGQALEFADEYAPEHLELLTEDPEALVPLVRNAGSVFLGPYSPNAAGDYATGANHVHPTGGKARTYGPLSVEAFGRWVQVQALTREGLGAIRDTVGTLAHAEGLQGHARSVEMRFAE